MTKLPKGLEDSVDQFGSPDYYIGVEFGALAVLEKAEKLAEALTQSECSTTVVHATYGLTVVHSETCAKCKALAEWKAFRGEK